MVRPWTRLDNRQTVGQTKAKRVRGRPKQPEVEKPVGPQAAQMLMMIASFSEHTELTIYAAELINFKRVNTIINIVHFLVYTASPGRQSDTVLITSVCAVTGSAGHTQHSSYLVVSLGINFIATVVAQSTGFHCETFHICLSWWV